MVLVGLAAAGDGKEFFLQLSRDWSGNAFADLNMIHGADGSDLDSGANEENFVNDVQHFAWDDRFFYRDAHVLRHLDDGPR